MPRSPSRAALPPGTAPPWPGSPRNRAGRRCSSSLLVRTGEGFDCPPLDGKATAEVHDYHDELTGVLASSLAKRAPGYTSLGFPDPRKLPYAPSADTARQPSQNDRQLNADRS